MSEQSSDVRKAADRLHAWGEQLDREFKPVEAQHVYACEIIVRELLTGEPSPTPQWEMAAWQKMAGDWLKDCSDHRGEQVESLALLLQHVARAAEPTGAAAELKDEPT